MNKPIFRWTMYETNEIGFEIFKESVMKTPISLGNKFKYMVFYNGKDQKKYQKLCNIVKNAPVLIAIKIQEKSQMPITINNSPFGMWKVCPPRQNINTHEIICDNDIIITKEFPKIKQFLSGNSTLLMKDPIRYFGSLDHLHEKNEQWNSGLIGLPPGFDFNKEIINTWKNCNYPRNIGYPEEQSLLTYCIKKHNPIIIELDEIVELLKDGTAKNNERLRMDYRFTGEEYGFHFVEANRSDHHSQWNKYKKWINK